MLLSIRNRAVPIRNLVVTVYTRHSAQCPKKNDQYSKRCNCPKWLYINNNGKRSQRSAKTRAWDRAEETRRAVERDFEDAEQRKRAGAEPNKELATSLGDAVSRFLSAKKQENLSPSTVAKLTTIFAKQLLSWATEHNIKTLERIGGEELEAFRATWKDAPLARKKKQERVIGFFYYCLRMGWIKSNPAILLGRVKVTEKPTDYFPKDEFNKIVDATYVYNPRAWNSEPRNQAARVRTLVWLMRWSGLAISDAVGLERSRLNEHDELHLYRAKTGQPVYVPLPHDVADALRNIPPGPKPNPRYFFWTGNGLLKSAVSDWQRSLRRVFKLANIRYADGTAKRCHPHMFRDTFAVESLLAGVPLEQVSILLGHQSIKITEKHYAPWVKARQEQLTTSVRKSWPDPPKPERRARKTYSGTSLIAAKISLRGPR
jgi:integrase/recombinase XerD